LDVDNISAEHGVEMSTQRVPSTPVPPPPEQRAEAARKLAQTHNAAVKHPANKPSVPRFKETKMPGQGFIIVGAKPSV
jgi:hypothetical protein